MIGKEILNYHIVSFLGQGGMGSVYLAEHKHVKNQKVAIKMINADMVNDYTKSKLQEEAEHLAKLNHTNIVHFIDYHIDEAGNLYLIMEYADGVSLDKYIETISGLIVEERICPIFEPILDAVGFAHKHGIIHRDIKPNNIVITSEGTPKILDFGIATIIKDKSDSDSDNMIMGTPSYMSPEQVKGEKLDGRSDVYSLGVLLHQMMTGNAPYDTTTLTEFDINKKVVEEPLPRMRTFYKYVSEKVQKVVDKATAKNPSERYQTCEDFKKALHKAIYPPKFPLWGKISIAATLLLVVSLGVYWWDYTRTKVYYYHDYVEQWGVPVGIGEISESDRPHVHRMYRMEYTRRQLVRLSHVNCLDVIIGDDESERNDRPLDAVFFYNGEGKLSRVKVMDHNGKFLYVKSYNENLKTVIFQYDDQYGTEKTLASKTIGYVHAFTDDDAQKGKISRWLLEYDENGYVTELRYAGFQNVRVPDGDNIYGRRYKRDAKGRVIEENYLALDGSLKPTTWGMGKKLFVYDANDNWVKSQYLTIDDEPSLDAKDGVCVFEMEYDKYGNLTNAYHKNADGSFMLPKMNGVAGIHTVYDENGYIRRTEIHGIDGGLSYGLQGWSYYETEVDDHGFFNEMRYFDPQGNAAVTKEGYSIVKFVNDSKGNMLESWFYGEDGNLIMTNNGYAGIKSAYDTLGYCTSVEYYDTDRKLCIQNEGYAGFKIEYDEFGRITKFVNYDETRTPCFTQDYHVMCTKREYDLRGNETSHIFCDASDSLVLSKEDIAGWKSEYDDNGNEVRRVFIGTDGNIRKCLDGAAEYRYTYDEYGYLKTSRYYDEKGNLVINSSENCAGYNNVHDERGNLLEYTQIGRDEKRMPNNLVVKYKYDKNDNCIETAFFEDEKPAVNYRKYHREVFVFNNRNLPVETRYYDVKGNLIAHGTDKYAIVRNEYDLKGNRVKSFYFGTDDKPVVCAEGWSSSTYQYDAFGQVIRQFFFDVEGKPTDPKVMVPEGACEYDLSGNMTYLASMDGHGKLISNPQTGWSVLRNTFDASGNCTSASYFDENDAPFVPKTVGFHKGIYKYDKRGNCLLTAYYDMLGKPMLCEGFHKKVCEYDEQGRQISEAIFDVNGKPTEGNYSFHKVVYYYSDDSNTATTAKLYGKSNQLLNTLRYNKRTEEWELASQPTMTQAPAPSSSNSSLKDIVDEMAAEMPQSLGEDANNLCMYSLVMTSQNSCELILRTEESKYEMSESLLDTYIQYAELVAEIFKNNIPSNCYVTVILQDSKERQLSKCRK